MEWERIAQWILVCLMGAVCMLLLPWLRERLGAEKLKTLWKWVCVAVQAAEQIFGAQTGEQKKAYVLEWLKNKGIREDAETMDALVEAAVRELT